MKTIHTKKLAGIAIATFLLALSACQKSEPLTGDKTPVNTGPSPEPSITPESTATPVIAPAPSATPESGGSSSQSAAASAASSP